MADQPTPAHVEMSIDDPSLPMVTFTIDPKTLLFQTHKSEDVSVLQNRISQLEIHELLMQINLDLIPRVQVIQRAVLWYMIGLALSSLFVLVMLLLQDIRLLKPIVLCFAVLHVWILGVIIAKKIVYDFFIRRAIKSKEELYASRGLNWKVRNSFFSQFQTLFCRLELHLVEQSEPEPEHAGNGEHIIAPNELMFARIFKTQSPQDTSMRKRVATIINFTLGPGVSKAFPGPETVRNYTFLEVGVTDSNRFRKKSIQATGR